MQPRDTLIRELQKHNIQFEPLGEEVAIVCPFKPESDGLGGHLATFLINDGTRTGICTYCRKTASFSEVLAQRGVGATRELSAKYESDHRTSPFISEKSAPPIVLPSIYSWKEFNAYEFPWANQWRIKGLIPISARCVLAAPSGEGKSWLAMEMARCVAAGVPYLGHPGFETTKCKVLYIENETAKYDFQRRGRRLGFHEIEEGIFTPRDDWPPLNIKKNAEALYEFVKKQEIGFVILDTFRSVAGGIKENEADEIRKIFDNFKPFMESGITVLFTDHCRKPHPNEGGLIPKKEQLLGSQDKFSAPEVVIMLRTKHPTNTETGSTATINVYPKKNKGGPEANPFQIDIVHTDNPDGSGTTTLTYANEIDDKVIQAAVTEDAIKDYLAGQTEKRDAAEIVEALRGRAGKSNIDAKLKELREAKKVGFTKEGQKFLYWSLGEEDVSGDDLPPLFEDKPAS